jgi:hypothetical protein
MPGAGFAEISHVLRETGAIHQGGPRIAMLNRWRHNARAAEAGLPTSAFDPKRISATPDKKSILFSRTLWDEFLRTWGQVYLSPCSGDRFERRMPGA